MNDEAQTLIAGKGHEELLERQAGDLIEKHPREATFGAEAQEGDLRRTMFSREGLAGLLREAGFAEVGFAFQARRNGRGREMEIRGVRT